MTALAHSIVVSLDTSDDHERVITAIRTIRGVAGVKLVFGEVRAVAVANSARPVFDPNLPIADGPVTLPKDVIEAAAAHFRIAPEKLISHDRHASVSEARAIAMFICKRRLHPMSFPEVGRAFQRDHTTVQSAVERIEGFLWVGDQRLERAVDAIMSRLPAIIEKRTNTQGEPKT